MEEFMMFKVSTKHLRLSFIGIIVFGCLLFISACNSGEENASSEASNEDNVETDVFGDKDDFINKSIYFDLPEQEEWLDKFQSFAFTNNGHENRIDFLGEEEIDGMMTNHFYIKLADDNGATEYEVWMNDEGFSEKTLVLNDNSELSGEVAYTKVSSVLEPLYEFNREFRQWIQADDFTVTSHETHTDKLLDYDVVVHTIKGVDRYGKSGETEYEVVVADAGEFEFILEYKFHEESNLDYNFALTEMEFR